MPLEDDDIPAANVLPARLLPRYVPAYNSLRGLQGVQFGKNKRASCVDVAVNFWTNA
jgi:hypothetical protein